ncbi:MAG: hemerythrin domain-containing protein [Micromonosporaceae bacterium]
MTRPDVIDILTQDHQEIASALGLTVTAAQRRDRAPLLMAMLVRHAVAEEEYVYPLVRDQVTGGERVADRGVSQHAQMEETMQQVLTVGRGDAELEHLFQALVQQFRRHVRHDEVELFPRLRGSCTSSDLNWLGSRVSSTKTPSLGRGAPNTHTALIDQVRAVLTAGTTRITTE